MAKSHDQKKETKKTATKSLKEKRAEKKAKKGQFIKPYGEMNEYPFYRKASFLYSCYDIL